MRPQDEYGMFALRISILIASGARSAVYAKMDQCVGHQSGYQPLVSSGRAMAAVMPSTARSRS